MNLATTVSSALQPQYGRIRFPVDTLIFCSFLDNAEIIENKIFFWKEK